ncbi:adenosylmethionine--8-amino-7-oxononanoate transaminase [Campylobacter geochelonis]|uniref:Multifunctional fusion protein n=1 Tax=Campylobacter geochelonis TaxID=1780362 RepID=A0A128EC61_9BACT|nr:adenosylmethionine--8-amino-7-oxononanoate transaminase [Campylobacter geochelonis]QKF70711.1 bifunctional 7,8-diaminopelargonic acid synthase / dethiobiotin synthetase [Campylobacter geochelonis]CZE45743.1 adenosylmethionine-8-amino-7-oxononanoate aminotransferase [Campylobacter geochelonis]
MNSFFITATNTDVGKTFITCAILQAFLDAKFNAKAIKPVQTGCEICDGKLKAPDVKEYERINPKNDYEPLFALKFPASPHFSANLENVEIKMSAILRYIENHAKNADITLVEGAGGLFVPLNESENFIDVISASQIPAILVAKNELGCLNHILLSIEALQNRGVKIPLLVLNFHDENDEICLSNLDFLRAKFKGEIVCVPNQKDASIKTAAAKFSTFVKTQSKLLKEQIFKNDNLEFDKKHLWHPYTSALHPLKTHEVIYAKGAKIYTKSGELIDGMSSWWCEIHGYNNDELNAAATAQIHKFSHVMFGGLTHEMAINLGKKLLEIMPEFNQIFYSDSGSVSVEVALKMALQYQQNKNKEKNQILTVLGGYHGDTFGAMSVCDPQNGMHFLFNGVLAKQIFAPKPKCAFNKDFDPHSLDEISQIFQQNQNKIAALIIEPIVQGAGGMWFYHPKYLRGLRKLCDKFGALLIFDEIATGFGRTGEMFAYQHAGISPDIITIGKALTGGFMSFAATLTTKEVAHGISQNGGVFMHGPTFMANPLACAVSLKSIEILMRSNWRENVAKIEQILKQELAKCAKFSVVRDVRVLGAIGVVELKEDVNVQSLQEFFVLRGVWIRPFGKNIYLMPPFIISKDELVKLTDAVCVAIKEDKFRG